MFCYFILVVYRENNDEKSFLMDTYFKPNQKIDFTVLMGNADSFQTTTDSKGNVPFTLLDKNSFCLSIKKLIDRLISYLSSFVKKEFLFLFIFMGN